MSADDPIDERVTDPDIDLHSLEQLAETRTREWDILLACAGGGVLGAWARYGLGLAAPHAVGSFAWSTVIINASGCLLIGVLMVVLREVLCTPHRLVRPFLGVGVLGGYTTYSTFAVDAVQLVRAHHPVVAFAYVVVTVVACVAAVAVGLAVTRSAAQRFVR